MVSFLYLRSRMGNAKVSPTLNEEYYRETMRIVFVKYWRPTLKMLLHYADLRKTSLSEITVDEIHDLVNSG